MTRQQKRDLKESKRLGDAIVLLSLTGLMTDGERRKVTQRYVRFMAKRGVTVTRVDIAGRPILEVT